MPGRDLALAGIPVYYYYCFQNKTDYQSSSSQAGVHSSAPGFDFFLILVTVWLSSHSAQRLGTYCNVHIKGSDLSMGAVSCGVKVQRRRGSILALGMCSLNVEATATESSCDLDSHCFSPLSTSGVLNGNGQLAFVDRHVSIFFQLADNLCDLPTELLSLLQRDNAV